MLHRTKNLGLKFKCDNFYTIGIKKYNKFLLAVWRCMCTLLEDTCTTKQYLQNGSGINDNSPLHAWASGSCAFDQAYNNKHFWALCFQTVLDNAESRLEFMCQEWLHIQSSVNDLPPQETELIIAAVGWAQLLLRIKLIHFRDLINIREKSLAGETEKPVTILDLHICWDMVWMQVLPTMIRILSSPGILQILQEEFYLHLNA